MQNPQKGLNQGENTPNEPFYSQKEPPKAQNINNQDKFSEQQDFLHRNNESHEQYSEVASIPNQS